MFVKESAEIMELKLNISHYTSFNLCLTVDLKLICLTFFDAWFSMCNLIRINCVTNCHFCDVLPFFNSTIDPVVIVTITNHNACHDFNVIAPSDCYNLQSKNKPRKIFSKYRIRWKNSVILFLATNDNIQCKINQYGSSELYF